MEHKGQIDSFFSRISNTVRFSGIISITEIVFITRPTKVCIGSELSDDSDRQLLVRVSALERQNLSSRAIQAHGRLLFFFYLQNLLIKV